tara:strand:- start:4150 stop:4449 length:300 start_codon:yes stop_codon:yes gene_type:complete
MKLFRWVKHRIGHKLEHLKWASIKKILKEHGLALVTIVVIWEIIEDILFPLLFIFLGHHVHPVFYAGAPASWLLCVHWLAVPIIWGWWVKISKKEKKDV